ncbi:MAG: FAD-dependent oxidoreductase [Solirubrobacteraceae bacterium]
MARRQDQITVVGGGIAGLVAAIACAKQGRSVVLHEATGKLGGRARGASGPYLANYGPHALYGDGPFYAWLRREKLLPRLVRPSVPTLRTRINGRITRLPLPLVSATVRLRGRAPAELDYRTWAAQRAGERAVEAAVGFVSLPTFHHDPGELSAAFCHERFHRLVFHGHRVRYVVGGWNTLIDKLARRASDLGVEIETGSRITELPYRPVILALPLSAASALLPDLRLSVTGARTVLLDIAISSLRRSPRVVFDLTERLYLTRITGPDRSLAPTGEDLIQASAGLRPDESIEQATRRIESVMDAGFPSWRERETWRRRSLAENASGAIDLPGTTWRDRPAIDQGDGLYLAGDAIAAPGLLSEVSFNSAMEAARFAGGMSA